MPKYSGSLIYNEALTNYEEAYCKNRVSGMTMYESYCKAYINVDCSKLSRGTIDSRCQNIEKKERIIKRLNELRELENIKKFGDNQTEAEPFEIFEQNPKKTMFYLFYNYMNDCKIESKRAEQFKAIEAIAKMFNLFSDGSITNNQLNQIIIQAPDVNKAIESITGLVNAKQISQK